MTTRTDLQSLPCFENVAALYEDIRQPGTGLISDAAEIHARPDGHYAVFSAVIMDALDGSPTTRIGITNLLTGETDTITPGSYTARSPKYSPSGRQIAYLVDRTRPGDFQLVIVDGETRATTHMPKVPGWIEYLHWSPDGTRILLGVADHGADIAGRQGAIPSSREASSEMSWMPTVEIGNNPAGWRHIYLYEPGSDRLTRVGPTDINYWEAAWCGNEALVALVSPGPQEGLWYSAELAHLDIADPKLRILYRPKQQAGVLAASPEGDKIAFVEAICSDRGSVAGDLQIVTVDTASVTTIATADVNVTSVEWRSQCELLVGGHRGLEAVIGVVELASSGFRECWSNYEINAGEYLRVSGLGEPGNCAVIAEGFFRSPEIALVRGGVYSPVKSFDHGYAARATAAMSAEQVHWSAPDGLAIEGWLLRPRTDAPHPLILHPHGGPVTHWRSAWLPRHRGWILLAVERGYAVFLPNPRGSSGRGQKFAAGVLGDMGGADSYDCLSGVDHLVQNGIADPERLGVTGVSYGGFMTSWLITQDNRFAAAVSVAPMTNFVSQHLVSNIPHFVSHFLGADFNDLEGKYFTRSPVLHAHKVRTPTLNICGARDRCTPPEEARQFHSALQEAGVDSGLITYPEEGHAIRKFPAVIDYTARLLEWFESYMPPHRPTNSGPQVGAKSDSV